MKSKISFILTFVCLIFVCFNGFANNVSKIDKDGISKFINNFAIEFENISKITNQKLKEDSVYTLANNILDLDWMGNFILGKYRKTITQQEKQEFIDNYSKILIKNYISVLDVYKKDSYKIILIEQVKENTFNISSIVKYNDKEVKNNFRIIKKDNKYFIRDIITEGISFISAQRSEINSVITSKGFSKFLNELKIKNDNGN
ncbi:MAG: ABC transporter substrate-binding protein [Rickettsiales bacterium]|nr:ABC transporter substrate-binding protein [Rickettsiales bacterium]